MSFLSISNTREGYKSGCEHEVGPIFTSERRKKMCQKERLWISLLIYTPLSCWKSRENLFSRRLKGKKYFFFRARSPKIVPRSHCRILFRLVTLVSYPVINFDFSKSSKPSVSLPVSTSFVLFFTRISIFAVRGKQLTSGESYKRNMFFFEISAKS